MNIVMVTNTYTPHVGGVAKSVQAFTEEYRRLGHRVLVIAPEFDDAPDDEEDVVRVPAIQNFNGSDFSVRIPVPEFFSSVLRRFEPDVVHSHHPFLLGGTALRIAASWNLPLIFTHHTLYEHYTHYVPVESPALKRFVIDLATGYANLCDQVFAPSESIAALLRQRGVETPIEAVPTGVDAERFARGDGAALRESLGISGDAFVVGHIGRLAPEKNLGFLARALARFLREHESVHCLIGGSGPCAQEIRDVFAADGLDARLHLAGVLKGQRLVDAYHAMDVFAFASTTETQGMVLTEAMAAGTPVVALDASGAREVVKDGRNGRLLPEEDVKQFAAALRWVYERFGGEREALHQEARQTAEKFSMSRCAERAVSLYGKLIRSEPGSKETKNSLWEYALRRTEAEWELWSNRARAARAALGGEEGTARPRLWRRLLALCRQWSRVR